MDRLQLMHRLFDKGNFAYNLGDYMEAIKYYEELLDIMVDYETFNLNFSGYPFDEVNKSTVWNNLGMAYAKLGNFNKALECFENAISLNPNFHKVWYNKGLVLAILDRYKEAIKCYDKALEINPNYVSAWVNKGNALVELCKYEEAVECYDKALEIDPNNELAKINKIIAINKMLYGNSP